MVQYYSTKVSISDGQKKKMVDAIHAGNPFSLRLTNDNLYGDDELWLTARQKNKLEKHKAAGKGIVLKFSHRQLRYMGKASGFLLGLLGSALGSLIPGLFQTGVKSVEKAVGSGVKKRGQLVKPPKINPDDLGIHGGDFDEHEGGLLPQLLLGLASGAISNLLSGAVNRGVAKKAGVEPPTGSGFVQLKSANGLTGVGGRGLKSASGLTQLGVRTGRGRKSIRSQVYEDSDGMRVI